MLMMNKCIELGLEKLLETAKSEDEEELENGAGAVRRNTHRDM